VVISPLYVAGYLLRCSGTDPSVSLKLLVPDVKKEGTNSSDGGGSDGGGSDDGNDSGTATTGYSTLPVLLVLLVTLVHALL